MLDVYLKGNSTRLCPEAPIPVVDIAERIAMPGGAANAACNFSSLGAKVTFCTVAGNDSDGREAISHLHRNGLRTDYIIEDTARKTLAKTRVLAGNQLITRFDAGSTQNMSPATEEKVIQYITGQFHQHDVVVISDYDKGILTEKVVNAIANLQAESANCLAIDSKRLDVFARCKPTVVKPNVDEASKLLRHATPPLERAGFFIEHGHRLHSLLQAKIIALTLDREGSLLFRDGKFVCHAKAPFIPSPSVSGAGDTYLSAFMLSYCTGSDIAESADIATVAASIAIQQNYTTTCTLPELKASLNKQVKVIQNESDLKQIAESMHAQGKTIVLTNGCFDILHSGHVTYLHCAKKLGDVLIAGINTDESIRRLKGNSRPVNKLADRIEVLGALSAVDYVVPFGNEHDDTPKALISLVRPHVFAKGGDYDIDRLPEADTVAQNGGKIVFLPLIPDHSTTRIIQRINSPHTKKELVDQP